MAKSSILVAKITANFIEQLKKEGAPWRTPWVRAGPMNFVTERPYKGFLNRFCLGLASYKKGYDDPRWAGYAQIAKMGGMVRRGERATKIIAPNLVKEVVDGKESLRMVGGRIVNVFNAAQCDNVPVFQRPEPRDPNIGFEECATLVENSGAKVSNGGDKAFYSPAEDAIRLPFPGQFKSMAGYWATMMHEMTHWTGHRSRLDRLGITNNTDKKVYAFEELIAEIGSATLCQCLGVDSPDLMPNHEAYVKSWIACLENDPKELVRASALADKATKYLLNFRK